MPNRSTNSCHGAVVLLVTDGLDRDPEPGLAAEADRLHRSCRKLIWLNPLLRWEGFQPRAQGVKALLPMWMSTGPCTAWIVWRRWGGLLGVEFIPFSTYACLMALSIKSPEVEKLAAALAAMTGESKTEAIRRALIERRERLSLQHVRRERGSDFLRYLQEEVWPKAPPGQLGRRLSREEEDEILGYGPEGV